MRCVRGEIHNISSPAQNTTSEERPIRSTGLQRSLVTGLQVEKNIDGTPMSKHNGNTEKCKGMETTMLTLVLLLTSIDGKK